MFPLRPHELPRTAFPPTLAAAPAPAPAASSAPAPAPAPLRVRVPVTASYVRHLLCLLPLVMIGVWAAVNWRVMYDGALLLTSADPGWLLVGAAFTCLYWASAACIRQGAIAERLPLGPLLATQVAAGAANQILPAGLGPHAIMLRFLQRRGIPLARATASLALYTLVKPVTRLLVILAFLMTFPGTVRLDEFVLDARILVLTLAGVAVCVAVVPVVTAVPPLRRLIRAFLRTALTDARHLHTRPSRVLALWGGAAAFPLLQAAAFASVGAALGLPLAWHHAVFVHLVANAAVGAIPTPGGIGSVDAVLVFTLATFGAPMALATSTVIGYRVLTVWFPLLPGVLAFSLLVRRGML